MLSKTAKIYVEWYATTVWARFALTPSTDATG